MKQYIKPSIRRVDPHTAHAAIIFNKPTLWIDSDERQQAKRLLWGYMYGVRKL